MASADPLKIYLQEHLDPEELKTKIEMKQDEFVSFLPSDKPLLRKRMGKVLNYFLPKYSRADLLATRYQNYYKKASMAIYFLAATAVIVVAGQYIFNLNHWVASGEIIAIVCILLIISVGSRIGWHRRWVDYRFLAERLRYGIFMAFLSENKLAADNDSLTCQYTDFTWSLKQYHTIWNNRPRPGSFNGSDLEAIKCFFQSSWLDDQKNYHHKKNKVQLNLHENISSKGELFFRLTLVAALLHLLPNLLHLAHFDIALLHHDMVKRTLTFFAIAFPAIATACSGLRAHFDFRKIADRSAMMERNLIYLTEQLQSIDTFDSLQGLAQHTESLMIQENADWCVTIGVHCLEPG